MSAPKGKAMPIAALIGMAHPDDGKGDDGAGGSDGSARDDAKDAMDMFIAAVHDRDTEGALTHFENLMDLCGSYEKDGGDEEAEGAGEEG